MKAVIFVTLKPSVFDPQGEAVRQAMAAHGLESVRSVRIGKRIEVELKEAGSRAKLERICRELLSNPVIENYELIMPEAAAVRPAVRKKTAKKAATRKVTAKKSPARAGSAKARKPAAARKRIVPPKPVSPPKGLAKKAPAQKTSITAAEVAEKAKARAEKKRAKEARKAAKKEKKAAKKAEKKLKKAAEKAPQGKAAATSNS